MKKGRRKMMSEMRKLFMYNSSNKLFFSLQFFYHPPLTYSLVILTLSKMNFISINKENKRKKSNLKSGENFPFHSPRHVFHSTSLNVKECKQQKILFAAIKREIHADLRTDDELRLTESRSFCSRGDFFSIH